MPYADRMEEYLWAMILEMLRDWAISQACSKQLGQRFMESEGGLIVELTTASTAKTSQVMRRSIVSARISQSTDGLGHVEVSYLQKTKSNLFNCHLRSRAPDLVIDLCGQRNELLPSDHRVQWLVLIRAKDLGKHLGQ